MDALCSGTERPWQSETEANVPPGFNFTPSDKQLIVDYLQRYADDGKIPWDHIVEERVYEKEPWELLGHDRDDRYFFTRRTKCGFTRRTKCRRRSSRVRRTVGRGTWTGKARKNDIVSAVGEIIGYKTMLSYCVDGRSVGYTMYEYELPQSVTDNYDNYMQEEGAPLQQLVLCCVKKSPQKIVESRKRRAAAAAAAAAASVAAAVVSSKQARHEGGFEVGVLEHRGCNSSAVVDDAAQRIAFTPENADAGPVDLDCKAPEAIGVTAANCNDTPLGTYAADCSATPPVHLSAAAEASLEGRVHTEAIDFASADQILSSSAVDQQPPACSGSYCMEDLIKAVISDTCERDELKITAAEMAGTAEHHSAPLSGQDGDQPAGSAIYIDQLTWWRPSNLRDSPPLPPFDWEMLPPTDILSDTLWSSDF